MLYGVETDEGDAPPMPAPPPVAYAIADFTTGTYSYNGVSKPLSDVTSASSSLVSSSGLHLVAASAPAAFAGDFRTALLTFNWTILFELNIDATGANHVVLHVGTYFAEHPFDYSNDAWVQVEGEWDMADENNDVGAGGGPGGGSGSPMSRDAFDFDNGITNAIHKVAVTRTNDRVALSVDGFPHVTDNSQGPFSMNTGTPEFTIMGAFSGDNIYNSFFIRKMQIFNPVADSILPSLSA